ncbi:hypothetical protein D3C79_1067930 [compost metagenome]
MVMVMVLIAAAFELNPVLKHHLLQNSQLLHHPQIAVYGIEAESAVFAAHMLINILRG